MASVRAHPITHLRVATRAASQRVVALDILRGYFLFVMIVDHLQRFPGLFDLLTGRDQMWVSAAEGFFFVSGMVVAIARNRDANVAGIRTAAMNTWRRAGALYLWSVALTLLFTYLAFALADHHLKVKAGLIGHEGFPVILYQAATFQYIYGWTDFLSYYVVFLLAAPLSLWLLRRGWWWVVVIASVGVWLSSDQFACRWQLLFYVGMVCGFYLRRGESWFRDQDRGVRMVLVAALALVAGFTMLFSATIVYLQPHLATPGWGATLAQWDVQLAPYFDKGLLPLPRLLMFALWFAAFYIVTRRYETVITKHLGWFLLPLGVNSLYAYILHGFVVLVTGIVIAPDTDIAANVMITAAALALIWWLTIKRIGMGIVPR